MQDCSLTMHVLSSMTVIWLSNKLVQLQSVPQLSETVFTPPALPWTGTLPSFSPTPVDERNKGASCVPAEDQNILRTRKNNKNEVVADPGRCTNLSQENSILGWVPTHSIDASARVEQVHVVGIRNERRRHQPGRLLPTKHTEHSQKSQARPRVRVAATCLQSAASLTG